VIGETKLYEDLRKSWHIHFCSDRTCRRVYECVGFGTLDRKKTECNARTNARCQRCRQVARPLWVAARDSRTCCVNNVRQLLDRDELLRYRLAGPGPWYACATCVRPSGWPLGHDPANPPQKEHQQ
jgi:hypothetical protein